MSRWNPSDWFGAPAPMTIGVECEMVIVDGHTWGLLKNDQLHRAQEAWKKLPDLIHKDYYPYQLEIRTDPHEDPLKAVQQMIDLAKLADQEFLKQKLFIVPVPWTGMGDDSFCGMHVHIRYKDDKYNKQYFERAWGAYPFVLALADHTKNAEVDEFIGSVRMDKSHHIKLPYERPQDFYIGTGEHRYRDITVNKLVTNPDDPKKTVKKVETLETRIYDTPSLYEHMRLIIEGTYKVFSHIRPDNPVMQKGVETWTDKFQLTRALAIQQRYGLNKVLRESNLSIMETLGEYFDFPVPVQTQFEFREQFGGLEAHRRKLAMRRFSWLYK